MSAPYLKDRLGAVLVSTTLNGVDFVEVSPSELTLKVHFLNAVALATLPTTVTITGGETISTVAVPAIAAANWGQLNGRPLLTFNVAAPGDFSIYTLSVTNSALDPFFSSTRFSFKVNCPSDLDCKPPPAVCPPLTGDLPSIDYLAKDFLSFRQALLDFSTQNYPNWVERSEADFGMMFLEALSGIADDLSYLQDRIAQESRIDTATERRSIVRLARLVDYEPTPPTSAQTTLQLDVTAGTTSVKTGLGFTAINAQGFTLYWEVGHGLLDPNTGGLALETFPVDPRWNRAKLVPYIWDRSQACLAAGSTEMWVAGHGLGLAADLSLLIDTPALTSADAPNREIVVLTNAIEEVDPIFLTGGAPTPVTHVFWDPSQALQNDHALFWTPDLLAQHNNDPYRTVLAGNLVPATHGQTTVEHFAIPDDNGKMPAGAPADTTLAIVRTGPNDSPETPVPLYLYTLLGFPLAWLMRADATNETMPHPELAMKQILTGSPPQWTWIRDLLDADVFETAFTIDPMKYTAITLNGDGSTSCEYDGDQGSTIRFGDGVFGDIPAPGAVFEVTHRVGGTAIGNVTRDAITGIPPASGAHVSAVTNPLSATGGADEESDDSVRKNAPQAFRAIQYRAVRKEDYEKAAETLSWVERAGTQFRWTGSWLTVFTTADPVGSEDLSIGEEIPLIELLNRYRMAGYESYAPQPVYVSVDLDITVCACPDAFRGDVEAQLQQALSTAGFFAHDNWTFGQPLERSRLLAAINASYGVCGVLDVLYRRRGYTPDYVEMPDTVEVGNYQILRVDNDPNRPEAGTIRLHLEGGK